ncbi:MAG: hypothetical protein AAGG48_25150 [Planctomycetota bacterium]
MFRTLLIAGVVGLLGGSGITSAQEEKATGDEYVLRYALRPGQLLRYEVTHVAKTKTRIRGAEEVSQVQTVTKRHWDVTDVNEEDMTFDHVLDAVVMTQQTGDGEELRWNSESNEDPEGPFKAVASQIGKTIATLSVNPRGQETQREGDSGTKASLGMGSLTLAFPEEPVAIGGSWSVPRSFKARLEDGRIENIKIREVYTLEKVKTGVATISLRSEPLTPIREESVRAQVVQQLSNGTIRFDVDNGYMLSKELNWDETVVGFQGANSLMEYRARLSEKLIDDVKKTARK